MSFHQADPNNVSEIESSRLLPGSQFHPTDEELVYYYLTKKVANSNTIFRAIGELDLNKCEPWDFPAKAKMGHQGAFYFFSLRRKYGNGRCTSRSTEEGRWRARGNDHVVMAKSEERMVGFRKTLVFYKGPAAKGEMTNWRMHEYRLEGRDGCKLPVHPQWVVCRAFKKSVSRKSRLSESTTDNVGDDGECSTDPPKGSILPASSRIWVSRVPILHNQSIPDGNDAEYSTDPPKCSILQASSQRNSRIRTPHVPILGNQVPDGNDAQYRTDPPESSTLPASSKIWTPHVLILGNQIPNGNTSRTGAE